VIRWIWPVIALSASGAQAPKYAGPLPPNTDIPYLKHAQSLVETEAVEVKEEKQASDTLYTIAGESSPSKTPLPLPIFLLRAEKIDPLQLQMYRLTSAEGHRRISASGKKSADPIHVSVVRVLPGLFRLEVSDSLDPGEYMLSVGGSNQAFCFGVK
jgi:hypothetical protein